MKVTLLLLTSLLVGCAQDRRVDPDPAQLGAGASAIVGGQFESGEEAVVLLSSFGRYGGTCTGTLIAPRVVLTAKHCVQSAGAEEPHPVGAIAVGVGSRVGETEQYRVESLVTTPGVFYSEDEGGLSGALVGRDVAVLVLTRAIEGVEPIPVRRDVPDDMVGQAVTAVGFGRREDGDSGAKYSKTTVLSHRRGNILYTNMTICPGDSGGPMIQEGEPRRVIGIASFGQRDQCPSEVEGYNGVFEYLEMIDRAVLATGACVDLGEERCDSLDNDCDGEIDEGCARVGEVCEVDSDCAYAQYPDLLDPRDGASFCEDGRCTRSCDPLVPGASCGVELDGSLVSEVGVYCRDVGACAGRCSAGGARELRADGVSCSQDEQCASLRCNDPGDGVPRCLRPCQGDAGHCPVGEVCAATQNQCGSCVRESLVAGLRGIGEPCTLGTECLSSLCQDTGECTQSCGESEMCPGGFRCREGRCLRGELATWGEACGDNLDCVADAFCATGPEGSWCTGFCGSVESCPEAFRCEEASGAMICMPDDALSGQECTADDECLSGLCRSIGEDQAQCTQPCGVGAPCPIGLECRSAEDGLSLRCVSPPVETIEAGCAIGQAGASSHQHFALLLSVLALLRCGRVCRRR